MAEPQKHAGKYYCVNRSFNLTNKKTGASVCIAPGELIPTKALVDDEVREMLLKVDKIVLCTKDGLKLARTDELPLTKHQMDDMIEHPDDMVEVLRRNRFTNNSLLTLRSRVDLAKLPKKYLQAVEAALER